jgi:sterol desaturase/sphingolipid hydroxylase (fatty acid hydroxylase superfamily)
MHPIEHLVYFSAVLIPAVLKVAPFWVLNLISISLIVYPIPGHIGYAPFEKHHWLHHTEFNYNYGSSQLWDVLFGTSFEQFQENKLLKKASKEDEKRQVEAQRQKNMTLA